MAETPSSHSTGFARGGRGGRGRGRGRGRAAEASAPPPDPTPVLAPEPSGSGALGKFKPRMVKRVAHTETADAPVPEPSGRGARGRGRGRGAGRGRVDIPMTASGAFAMGPSEGSRAVRGPQGPTQSGMRRIDNSATPVDAPSGRGTNTAREDGARETFELDSDVGEAEEEGNATVRDLHGISDDTLYAPTVLTWDPKRVEERARLLLEREARLAAQKPKPEEEEQKISREGSSVAQVVTRDSTCTVTTSESVVKSESVEEQDLEALKAEVKLKKEQMEELAKVGTEFGPPPPDPNDESSTKSKDNSLVPLYIFQFPRNFPRFSSSSTPIIPTDDPTTTTSKPKAVLKKKKPQFDDWLGWGKGGRRDECPGVSPEEQQQNDGKSVEGQIGELITRRSGRVQMLIGDVAYDVLPAAQATFHQEIAVIDPKPQNEQNLSSQQRSMFVLGPTYKKFIVAPDVSSLLERDQRESKLKLEQQ